MDLFFSQLSNIIPVFILILLGFVATVPVATNSVILANTFNVKPEKASMGVFVTALASLVMIPLWNYLFSRL